MLSKIPQDIVLYHIIPNLDTKSLANFAYSSKNYKRLVVSKKTSPFNFRSIFTYILKRDLSLFEKYDKIFGITYISPWFHISKTSLNLVKNMFRVKTTNGMNELMNINDIVEFICSKLEKSRELRMFTFGNIEPILALNLRVHDIPIYSNQFRYSSEFANLKIVNMYHGSPLNSPTYF